MLFDDLEFYVGEDEEEEDGEYGFFEEKISYIFFIMLQFCCFCGIYMEIIEFIEKKFNLVKMEESLLVWFDLFELICFVEWVEDGDLVCFGLVCGLIWFQMILCGYIVKYYVLSLMNLRLKEESF